MKKIMLHVVNKKGNGPNSVLEIVRSSLLLRKNYQFVDLYQSEVAGTNLLISIKIIINSIKQLKTENPEIILIQGLDYSGLLICISAWLSRKKRIVVVHGFAYDSLNISWMKKVLVKRIIVPAQLRLTNYVYTVCELSEKRLLSKKYLKRKLFGTIHNCIPEYEFIKGDKRVILKNEYGITEDKIVVAVVGRVVEDKGHRYIINAWKKINFSRLVLLIIGEGPYLDRYLDELNKEIDNKSVILTGQRKDVIGILSETDIFLFTTLHENLSMALLEAAINKCAIIATNVGGNPEVIKHRQTGILIPPYSSSAIIDAVSELVNNHIFRDQLGRNAYEFVKDKYSIREFEIKMDELFKKCF